MEKLEIIREGDIALKEVLGGGGFGTVHRGIHKVYGDVAVKVLKTVVNKDVKKAIRREAQKMNKAITSEYFVRIKGLMETDQTMSIVMEYFELGSLRSFRRYLDHDCLPRMIKMILEISMGMNYLHTLNPPTLHRDLKVDNIFVGQGFQIKIGDFGLAQDVPSITTGNNKDMSGTCTHLPPELLAGDVMKPTMKMDIYGFSITVYEFVSGEFPWPLLINAQPGQHVSLLTQWLEKGKRPSLDELPEKTPKPVISLMEQCWHQDPDKRPPFQEIQETLTELYDREYKTDVRRADLAINHNMVTAQATDTNQQRDDSSGIGTSASSNSAQTSASVQEKDSEGISKPTLSNSSTCSSTSRLSESKVRGQIMSALHKTTHSTNEATKHVMISYQWDSQDRMVKLRDALLHAGFDIWMDVDRMEGHMNDRMAEAVENAAAVLVCFSEKYQHSQNCKKEVNYAQFREVPIIPLKFEEYKPSGYLGLAISSLLYYDVTSDEEMTRSIPSIIKALKKHTADTPRPRRTKPTPQKRRARQNHDQDVYANVEIGALNPDSGPRRPRPPAPLPESAPNKPTPPIPPPKPKSMKEEVYANLGEQNPPQRLPSPAVPDNRQEFHGQQAPYQLQGALPREHTVPGPAAYYPSPSQPVAQVITKSTPGAIEQLQRDFDKFTAGFSQQTSAGTVPKTGVPAAAPSPMQTGQYYNPQPSGAVMPGQPFNPQLSGPVMTVPQMILQKQVQLVQQKINAVHCFHHFIAVCGLNSIGVYDMEKAIKADDMEVSLSILQPEYMLSSPDWNGFPGDVTSTSDSLLAIVFGNPVIYQYDMKQSVAAKNKFKIARGADPRAIQAGSRTVVVVTKDLKLRVFMYPSFKAKSTHTLTGLPSTMHVNQDSLLIATSASVLHIAMDGNGTLGKKVHTTVGQLGNCKGAMFHSDNQGPKAHDPFYVISDVNLGNQQRDGTMHTLVWNPKTKEYVNAGCIARGIPPMIWKGMHISEKGNIVIACEPNRLLIYWPYEYFPQITT